MTAKQSETAYSDFHAVAYMRDVRSKLSVLYHTDRAKYLETIRQAMDDFKRQQQLTTANVAP